MPADDAEHIGKRFMAGPKHPLVYAIRTAIFAERERCAKVAQARAEKWATIATGKCTESLIDECWDIADAIRYRE